MLVREVMTRPVEMAKTSSTIQQAAARMQKLNVGALPVAEQERVVGMITDRDIALRAVARGLALKTPIRDVMSSGVKYCFDDEDVDHVLSKMADAQVRRLPVINRDKRLVGILSLGDVATAHTPEATGQALRRISRTRSA